MHLACPVRCQQANRFSTITGNTRNDSGSTTIGRTSGCNSVATHTPQHLRAWRRRAASLIQHLRRLAEPTGMLAKRVQLPTLLTAASTHWPHVSSCERATSDAIQHPGLVGQPQMNYCSRLNVDGCSPWDSTCARSPRVRFDGPAEVSADVECSCYSRTRCNTLSLTMEVGGNRPQSSDVTAADARNPNHSENPAPHRGLIDSGEDANSTAIGCSWAREPS